MALPVSTSWFDAKLREPSNAACPGVKRIFFNCYIRGVCGRGTGMGVVSRDFAEVGWRRGLGARKPRSGVRNQRHEAGCRHRGGRGAGGRPRCVWGARCTLCGCEALRSARLTSRQTVTRRTLRIRRGWIYFWSFSTADAVDIRSELTRVVRLEADRLVGPVVALAEQNAIDLAPAVVASSHTCKETFRGIAAEGQTEAP